MTVYNGERFLQPTLDALLAQSLGDYELVIVNNGSTDGTGEMLRAIRHPNFRLVDVDPASHGTFASGIRRAYEAATGKYFAVNDGDDVPAPDRLERLADLLDRQDDLGAVGSWFDLIDADGRVIGAGRPPVTHQGLVDAFASGNPVAHSTLMVRRAAAEAVGGYDTRFTYGCDFALQLALISAGWRLAMIDLPLMAIRQHGGQTSVQPSVALARSGETLALALKAQSLPGLSPAAARSGARALCRSALRHALNLWRAGRVAAAARLLAEQLTRRPLALAASLVGRRGR